MKKSNAKSAKCSMHIKFNLGFSEFEKSTDPPVSALKVLWTQMEHIGLQPNRPFCKCQWTFIMKACKKCICNVTNQMAR